ncbi:MAG: hypothetical protein ACI4E1_12125 [Lachnospira sp.]
MGEKDLTEKIFEDYNDVFADIVHVDELVKLLEVVTNDSRYEDILERGTGGIRNMCDVAERLERMGMEKGIEQGRAEITRLIISIKAGKTEDALVTEGFSKDLVKEYMELLEA